MKKSIYLCVLAAALLFARHNFAEELPDGKIFEDEYPKHGVDLRLAFWDQSSGGASVNLNGLAVEAGTGGISGKIMYNYYSDADLAFTFSVGAMASEVNVETFSSTTSTVAPIMMGFKYYFHRFETNNAMRPYLSGSFGMLVGTESGVKYWSAGTRTETAIGGYAGFGTDILLGSVVKLHADIGYNLYSDFNREIAGRSNYSGAEFSFGIGFIF